MQRGGGARFFGSYTNKIDAKGRLATPAAFRRVIDLERDNRIYCIPSTDNACLECGGYEYVENLMAMIEELDPYSPERISLELTVASQMTPLTLDKEGRLNLTTELREHAGLEDKALFAGAIRSFQIWNPATFKNKLAEAKKISGAAKLSLRNPPRAAAE
ncbi:MAG: cell division/cell wall cluster transcriptional repressor MraZ [Marinicaulis sp.]|nr:cell division/cell wall cluster transcriptional repressor MraZ [Marinicaulis sp.]